MTRHHDHRPPPARLPVLAAFGFLGLLGGALSWVLTGDWRWIAIGIAVFLAAAVVGAALDSDGKR